MKLSRSAWKRCLLQNEFSDYILILPEEGVILSFTSMQDAIDKRVVRGCWIREVADSIVYTALKKASTWRKESYELHEDLLTWDNGNGTGAHTWTRMTETDIPETLRTRGTTYLQKFKDCPPPEYEEAEQDAPSNGG